MPFGLSNAPSTFQALMNEIFRLHIRKFVLVFFYDILVYSADFSTHLGHLREVLQILKHHNLVVNRKKCHFGQPQLEYLGHIISASGVSADPAKITSMDNWPNPKDVKGLQGLLGLTDYYRKFVRDCGKTARPLTQLLKKDAFHWNKEAQLAFESLKEAMVTLPVLALPNFKKVFVVETDASGLGIGAVLMQEGHPIAFLSQGFSIRAQSKSVYERELMAIVFAVQKWRHYLMGKHFIIRTDQRSLQFLMGQHVMAEEQQKWVTKLMGFDFEIQYRPGCENKAADALSRQFHFMAFSVLRSSTLDDLSTEIQQDDQLRKLTQELLQNPASRPNYVLKNGCLFFKSRLVIPRSSLHIPTLLREFHSSPTGGHSGFFHTYKRISQVLYWNGIKRDVQNYVASCEVCKKNKYEALSPAGLLQPLPIPTQVWIDISMDFIRGYQKQWDMILYLLWWTVSLNIVIFFSYLTHIQQRV